MSLVLAVANRAALDHIVTRIRDVSKDAYDVDANGVGYDLERIANDLEELFRAPLTPEAASWDDDTTTECVLCGYTNTRRHFTTGAIHECPKCQGQDVVLPGGTFVRFGQRKEESDGH